MHKRNRRIFNFVKKQNLQKVCVLIAIDYDYADIYSQF